jgi:hypothetical protein
MVRPSVGSLPLCPSSEPSLSPTERFPPWSDRRGTFIWGLTQGILEAESDKSRPHKWATPNLERVKRCAKHLSNGALDLVDFPHGDLMEQRLAAEQALAIVERKAIAAHCERAAANYQKRADEWRELIRQKALHVVGLRSLNAALAKLKSEIVSGGQVPPSPALPCDRNEGLLLGSKDAPGRDRDCVREFLREAVSEGIVKPSEVVE